MRELSKTIGEKTFDGLITDINPPVQVRGRTIAALTAATTLKRGTILGVNAANKCVVFGTDAAELTPDSVLCDDTDVGTADVTVAVYTAGCFDPDKVTAADSYTMTAEDIDELRKRDIVFKAAHEAN